MVTGSSPHGGIVVFIRLFFLGPGGISRGAYKLVQTSTVIKKEKKKLGFMHDL